MQESIENLKQLIEQLENQLNEGKDWDALTTARRIKKQSHFIHSALYFNFENSQRGKRWQQINKLNSEAVK